MRFFQISTGVSLAQVSLSLSQKYVLYIVLYLLHFQSSNNLFIFWHVIVCNLHAGDRAKLAEDSLTEVEHDQYPFLENKPVEFQLRDEAPFLDLGVN